MSNPGVPVGQIAYQASYVAGYGAAMAPYAQTSNRYSGGSTAFANSAGSTGPIAGYVQRIGRRSYWRPGMGGAGALQSNGAFSTGGAGYVAGEIVTMAPVNRGRPIVVKVVTAPGGVPNAWAMIDAGSGLPLPNVGTNLINPAVTAVALTQASTTGAGAGATWQAHPGYGWVAGQPNPLV